MLQCGKGMMSREALSKAPKTFVKVAGSISGIFNILDDRTDEILPRCCCQLLNGLVLEDGVSILREGAFSLAMNLSFF